MWYLHFSDHFTQLFDDPIEDKFPQTTVLLLEQEGLYESCGYSLWGRMHPCGAWAPGRARKIDLKLTKRHFYQNLVYFGVMTKSFLTEEFSPRNRIETTNAFLDSLLPKEGRKSAPEGFLFGNRCDTCIFVISLPNFLTAQLGSNFPRQPYYS